MDLKKTLGFGVLFWVAMFVIVSVMIVLKLYTPGEPSIATVVIAAVLAYLLAGYAKINEKEALKVGLSWVVVGVVLDAVVTLRFAPDLFQMWTLWLGYVLVVVGVMMRTKKS